MNLVDLLKPPAGDTALPIALPAVGQPLPTLPAFADALARSQSAVVLQADLFTGRVSAPDAAGAPAELPVLPPEGLAWLASPALAPVAGDVADTDPAETAAAAVVGLPTAAQMAAQTVAPMPGAAPVQVPVQAEPAAPDALPRRAETTRTPPATAWLAPPAPAAAGTATPVAARRTDAASSAPPATPQTVAIKPREEARASDATAPEHFAGWLAAQTAEAEPAPAAPLQTTLRLPEPQAAEEPGKAWRQPLLVALGDRLQLQIAARSEQAVIRLEPPLLGRIDIAIRHEGGDLQVRMVASHAEVGRQLQQLTEPLRQDLLQRHSGEVSVQVSTLAESARSGSDAQAGGRGASAQQQQQQQHQERRPGRGLAEEGEAAGFAAPR